MAKKILTWSDESALSENILKVLFQQDQPKTAREIRRHLTGPFKLPEDRLLELLASLVAQGNLFEWPAKGKGQPRYWKEPLSPEFISKKIIASLTEKSLTPLELKRVLSKQNYSAFLKKRLIRFFIPY